MMGDPKKTEVLGLVLAQIFTNDASALLTERLSRDISKASAISFDKRDNPVAVIGLGQPKASGAISAFGLGLAPWTAHRCQTSATAPTA
jgi:hypothetical protein